jgi:tryptophanyl-tRNA synthetase
MFAGLSLALYPRCMSRIFSGVQPTAEAPHLGNYIGAFKQWVDLQTKHESFICLVDLHAITLPWHPEELADRTRKLAATLLACGIDPERTVLFRQSDVAEHTELAWILTCISRMGELNRMTQFKDKSKGVEGGSAGAGLFMYPVLMAADVLAYKADLVPVGDDQRQHLELMRDLAERFNRLFGETFPVPESFIPEQGARVMSLDDTSAKMSKSSDRPTGSVWMMDPPEVVREKIKRAVTDSGREIKYGPDKPAISNLLDIFAVVSSRSPEELAGEYEGKGYAEFKSGLADAVISFLQPFQQRFQELMDDPGELASLIAGGAEKARIVADKTLQEVRERIGLRGI